MIWFAPAQSQPTRKRWWDTRLSRHFGAEGLAAQLWVRHFFPYDTPIAENDRDHVPW